MSQRRSTPAKPPAPKPMTKPHEICPTCHEPTEYVMGRCIICDTPKAAPPPTPRGGFVAYRETLVPNPKVQCPFCGTEDDVDVRVGQFVAVACSCGKRWGMLGSASGPPEIWLQKRIVDKEEEERHGTVQEPEPDDDDPSTRRFKLIDWD